MSVLRARWAAVGAAVAVTLGAGGLATVSATQPDDAVTFVPISPCRLFDTRPDYLVGSRSKPLKEGENMTIQATGDNGECKGIPADATGVSMNLTTDRQTVLTFLTVWPADKPLPNASSINPFPGAPAPNAVTTKLSPDGKFKVHNEKGTTHVLADINGYYIDHQHDDRYYRKDEVDLRAPAEVVISVGSSAFSPMAADATASRGMADGGAWQVTAGAAPGLVADVQLPNDYILKEASAELWDDSTEDLIVTLQCESASGFGDVARATSSGASAAWVSVPFAAAQTITRIDNAECAYRVQAINPNWGTEQDALRIKSLRITLTAPPPSIVVD